MPIEFDEPTGEGMLASETIATIVGRPWEIYWHRLQGNDSPSAIPATIALEYVGGQVIDEVGGCCGSFLCNPCPYGLTVELVLHITTSDGLLDETIPATLTGDATGYQGVSVRENEELLPQNAGGSWPDQTFVLDDAPFEVQGIRILVAHYDGEHGYDELRVVGVNGGNSLVLGTSFPRPF